MAGPRQLILADDEPYVTSIVSNKLTRLGCVIRTATDGEQAFRLACELVPELVVSDYQMPVTDGFGLATKLKADPRTCKVPVILLTARGHLLTPTQLAQTNIRLMVAKPFSTKELLAQIEELIGPLDAAKAAA